MNKPFNRKIQFNAWLPEIGFMLEHVYVGYGTIGVPFTDDPEDDFFQFLKSKGFLVDEGNHVEDKLPSWLYWDGDWITILEEDKFVLLQCIGVKGYEGERKHKPGSYHYFENEVDLFEGDVVEAMSEGVKGTFVIVFRRQGAPIWLLYPNWQQSKHWKIHASDIGRQPSDYYDDLKRIGNIFQNPELINHEINL